MTWAEERLLFDSFGAAIEASYGGPPEMGLAATELASLGRPVFPLQGKVPRIPNAHGIGDPRYGTPCRGRSDREQPEWELAMGLEPCKADGHGLWDATTDQAKIDQWWTRWPNANIGIAIPNGVLVMDVDPRSGGVETMRALCDDWGAFVAATLSSQTGGHSLGRHFYFAWDGPVRKFKRGELPGIDWKRWGGYVVAPPSTHPETREPYAWLTNVRHRVGPPPPWLARVLTPVDEPAEPKTEAGRVFKAQVLGEREQRQLESIADWYEQTHYWEAILEPHGWDLHSGDGETNGSVWHAPGIKTKRSATVKHGRLFVWSTKTPFEPSEAGDPAGYTKFHAYAVLNHHGDRKAAARELWEKRKAATR